MTTARVLAPRRLLLNKVPEVTLYFWIIKVLCTTVGEAAADFLNVNLNFGLDGTSVVTGLVLLVALVVQFRLTRYKPSSYWLTVALVSVFGTLVTDNLTDNVGLPLETSTLIFSVLLALTFMGWYSQEKTLSIHSIVTRRREAFYWLAILFTFALGTATGDLMAEVLGLGYAVTGAIVVSLIVVTAIAWRLGLNPVLAFWIVYILTRPLGASIGDYLSQPSRLGGLGLGATVTSLIFTAAIVPTVAYLAVSKADVTPTANAEIPDTSAVDDEMRRGGLVQTAIVVVLVVAVATTGYFVRKSALQQQDAASASQSGPGGHRSPLGDVSTFRDITRSTLDLLNAGKQADATARVDDLEIEWDNAQARLKPRNKDAWTLVDGKIDTVLRELRATSPNPTTEKAALTALLTALG